VLCEGDRPPDSVTGIIKDLEYELNDVGVPILAVGVHTGEATIGGKGENPITAGGPFLRTLKDTLDASCPETMVLEDLRSNFDGRACCIWRRQSAKGVTGAFLDG
jgi:hypothetical protein